MSERLQLRIKSEDLNINNLIKSLSQQDYNINLDVIFKNPNLTNLFIQNKELFKLLFNFITTTKNKEFYELVDYSLTFNDDELIKMYNIFKFNNGKFTDIKLDKLDNGRLNTILNFNNKPTNNEYYNQILNSIKYFDISEFKFNDYFNDVLINNIHQDYKFKFMDKYINKATKTLEVKPVEYKNLKGLDFKFIDLMDKYILKFNDDSMLFKQCFYMLLCYVFNKKDKFNFEQLLNIFLNYNILFYDKIINTNGYDSTLITYLYFKNGNEYIPNLRYTIDLKGNSQDEKINILKNKTKKEFKGFETIIEEVNEGIRFNTHNYDLNEIIKCCNEYINKKEYKKLIYYIFNSQFLNRSTCLFGYFVYFYFTHTILSNTHYFDIIALTEEFDVFNDFVKIEDENNNITEFEDVEHLTLNYIINNIK